MLAASARVFKNGRLKVAPGEDLTGNGVSTNMTRTPGQRPPLPRPDRRRMAAMAAFIGALHLVGWGVLAAIVVPAHLKVGATAFGLGVGATAYVLGLRHAFDADHIAAIDNTTRRLMGRGQRPVSVGLWFALGHSTIVFGLALLIALGARALPHQLISAHSGAHGDLVLFGTSVSVLFLYAIAALNISAFVGTWRLFRHLRAGGHDQDTLDAHLQSRGAMSRIVQRVGKPVEKPWHMYLVGLLFGLGFDTATEIALLLLAGRGSASGLPWYAILCLPVLFAAGMCLLDSLDGMFMNFAYGWSLSEPVRKVYYNLTITALSIAVAIIIGTVELLGLVHDRLGLHHGILSAVSSVNLNTVGYLVVGVMFLTCAASLLVWRYARIEQRWSGPSRRPGPSEAGG
jgi:high-affinity nickel-transport protein